MRGERGEEEQKERVSLGFLSLLICPSLFPSPSLPRSFFLFLSLLVPSCRLKQNKETPSQVSLFTWFHLDFCLHEVHPGQHLAFTGRVYELDANAPISPPAHARCVPLTVTVSHPVCGKTAFPSGAPPEVRTRQAPHTRAGEMSPAWFFPMVMGH